MKVRTKELIHSMVVDEGSHLTLTIGKLYFVIGLEGNYYRIVDDMGEPLLFHQDLFDVIEPNIPNDWITKNEDGETFITPPELSEQYFYEDYFDGVKDVVEIFEKFRTKYELNKKSYDSKSMH